MEYKITKYKTTKDNYSRFILGKNGKNTLVVIGDNPSTANETAPDLTIKKVMGFTEKNSFDSFLMINVYPQRTTENYPIDNIRNENLSKSNIEYIQKELRNPNNITILAAWGNSIEVRPYLKECLKDIYKELKYFEIKCLKIGELKYRGNPRHPLRVSYKFKFNFFDINKYLFT